MNRCIQQVSAQLKIFIFSFCCISGLTMLRAQTAEVNSAKAAFDPATLPKAAFEWKGLWAHDPGNKSEDIDQLINLAKSMGFNVVLMPPKPAVIKAAHDQGLQFYAWVVNLYSGGQALAPKAYGEAHPEYLQKVLPEEEALISKPRVNPDRENISSGKYLCPDRGLLDGEKQGLETLVKNEAIDGLGLDYIGYRNYRACYCDYSVEQRKKFAAQHPDLSAADVLRRFSEESLIAYTRQVAEAARAIKPEIKIALHMYPDFDPDPTVASRLYVDYSGQTVAWFYKPFWSYEKIRDLARRYYAAEKTGLPSNHFVPFIGVYGGERLKSPERLRAEIRIAGSSGAKKLMVAFGETFLKAPDLVEVVTQELKP